MRSGRSGFGMKSIVASFLEIEIKLCAVLNTASRQSKSIGWDSKLWPRKRRGWNQLLLTFLNAHPIASTLNVIRNSFAESGRVRDRTMPNGQQQHGWEASAACGYVCPPHVISNSK